MNGVQELQRSLWRCLAAAGLFLGMSWVSLGLLAGSLWTKNPAEQKRPWSSQSTQVR